MNVLATRLDVSDGTVRVAPIACKILWASSSCELVGMVAGIIGFCCCSRMGESEAPEEDEDEVTLSLRVGCGPF